MDNGRPNISMTMLCIPKCLKKYLHFESGSKNRGLLFKNQKLMYSWNNSKMLKML